MIMLEERKESDQPKTSNDAVKGIKAQPTVKTLREKSRYTISVPKEMVMRSLQKETRRIPAIHSEIFKGVEKRFTKLRCQNSWSKLTEISTEPRQAICQKMSPVMRMRGKAST